MRGSRGVFLNKLNPKFSFQQYQELSLAVFEDRLKHAVAAVKSPREGEDLKKSNIFKVIMAAILSLQDSPSEKYPSLEEIQEFIWGAASPGHRDFHKQRRILSSFLSRLKKGEFVEAVGKRTQYRWSVCYDDFERFVCSHRKETPDIMEVMGEVRREFMAHIKKDYPV